MDILSFCMILWYTNPFNTQIALDKFNNTFFVCIQMFPPALSEKFIKMIFFCAIVNHMYVWWKWLMCCECNFIYKNVQCTLHIYNVCTYNKYFSTLDSYTQKHLMQRSMKKWEFIYSLLYYDVNSVQKYIHYCRETVPNMIWLESNEFS